MKDYSTTSINVDLFRGDTEVDLVVLCGEKPTKSLLGRIHANLPVQMATVAPDNKYETKMIFDEAGIIITSPADKEKRYIIYSNVIRGKN